MDKQEFEHLITRYRRDMLTLARARLRDDGLAEDAVQVACIRVWKAAPSLRFESASQARRYLSIATVSAAIDILRKTPPQREVSFSDILAEPGAYGLAEESLAADIAAREQAGLILSLLERMGPKYYRILSLRAEGYSNKEIAAMLELSVYDVGMTVHRGRKRLKEALKREGAL